MNELHEDRAKWYHLGVQLNMKPSDLNAIRVQFMNNPEDCLLEMLSVWLKREDPSPPSWQRVVDALCSPAIDRQSAGERLKQIYIDPAPVEAQEKSEGNNNKTAVLRVSLIIDSLSVRFIRRAKGSPQNEDIDIRKGFY